MVIDGARHCFNSLKPFLKHCFWPGQDYPMKRRHWNLDDQEIERQYKLLCSRVRLVSRGRSKAIPSDVKQFARAWRQTIGHRVRRIHTWGPLRAILQKVFQKVTNANFPDVVFLHAAVICSKVLVFIGRTADILLPPTAFDEFDCKPKEVAPVM